MWQAVVSGKGGDMKRYIMLEMLDHVSDAEVQDFADEINYVFQPHHDARVVKMEKLPEREN